MRAARKGDVIVAEPTRVGHTPGEALSVGELLNRGLEPLLLWLGISTTNPLRLLVPDASERRLLNQVATTSFSHALCDNALLELRTGNDPEQRVVIPSSVRVLIDAPPLALTWASANMVKRIRMRTADELEATLRLIELASEFCGSYARNAMDPRTGACFFDKPHHEKPFTHLNELQENLHAMHGANGLRLARKVAGHAIDGSGSPMETYLNLALTLPPRLAGVSMARPLANHQLVVDEDIRPLIDHKSLRPDLQWPDYNTLAEFLGDESHASKSARVEDKNRIKDYVTAQYAPIILMFEDVRNQTALNQTIQAIARELMRNGKRGELYRVSRILEDKSFLARQQTLIKTLLPPITRYDG